MGDVSDPAAIERGYSDELLGELRRDGRAAIERTDLVGSYPETTLIVVFRVRDRPCVFGVRDRIWHWQEPSTFDQEASVTSSYLRWLEALDTGELPHRCDEDHDGVTWLNLWEDWS
jgi:hypothetical protein